MNKLQKENNLANRNAARQIGKGLTKLVNENLLQELNELKAVMELGVHGKREQKVPLLFKSNNDSCFIN